MKLTAVRLDDRGLPPPTPEVEQERRQALYDLIEENDFRLAPRDGQTPPPGPYHLALSVRDGRLAFEVTTEDGTPAGAFVLSLTPFRQVIKDYFAICASYFDAVKRLPAAQIEAIDMGRRGIHNEGSTLLMERLAGKVDCDFDTARRLFTLICVLHFKG